MLKINILTEKPKNSFSPLLKIAERNLLCLMREGCDVKDQNNLGHCYTIL